MAWFDSHMTHARLLDGREISTPVERFPQITECYNSNNPGDTYSHRRTASHRLDLLDNFEAILGKQRCFPFLFRDLNPR